MSATAKRHLACGVLLVWGVTLSYFCLSGRIAAYLHPAFHIYTAISGGVFVLLAVLIFLTTEAESHSCCCHDGCCSGSFGIGIFPAMVLSLPLLLAVFLSPSRFGSTAVANRGVVDNIAGLPAYSPPAQPRQPPAGAETFLKKTKEGRIDAETVDLLYAAAEPTIREDFDGKDVEVIGQFLPAKTGNPNGDRFQLIRLFVMCCAADARPVAVMVQTSGKMDFEEMDWLKITGKATFPLLNGRTTPVVVADSVIKTEPPPDSFLY